MEGGGGGVGMGGGVLILSIENLKFNGKNLELCNLGKS